MPNFDGTGPLGKGPGTGKGRGKCKSGRNLRKNKMGDISKKSRNIIDSNEKDKR
ncbi:MAG: DUF5320 domain-containing protein [Deferribacterota bacterium]|nr:DUF5320 domain-containing protein [Deferribacterota bacterium]